VWDRALAASDWTGPPVWLHGDLHPHNLLLAPSGGLVAVVDFGDITAGDPATDLATAWLTFDARARRRFRAELEERRGVDEATWDRARGWALVIASAVVDRTGPESAFGRVASYALEQVQLD
jgi:aminoglycoside phosphotransferase (APT) family kinase protein